MDGLDSLDTKECSRKGRIVAFPEHKNLALDISTILLAEYGIGCKVLMLTERENRVIRFSSEAYEFTRQYFDGSGLICVFLARERLMTEFGLRIAAEAIENTIVASGPLLSGANLPRLIRHEVGHVFGLTEHLNCVMSPYWVDDHAYCSSCCLRLLKVGITWKDSLPVVGNQLRT